MVDRVEKMELDMYKEVETKWNIGGTHTNMAILMLLGSLRYSSKPERGKVE